MKVKQSTTNVAGQHPSRSHHQKLLERVRTYMQPRRFEDLIREENKKVPKWFFCTNVLLSVVEVCIKIIYIRAFNFYLYVLGPFYMSYKLYFIHRPYSFRILVYRFIIFLFYFFLFFLFLFLLFHQVTILWQHPNNIASLHVFIIHFIFVTH